MSEKTKKFEKPKRCRQLPQHLIHIVFQIFHMENQHNQLLVLHLMKIISGSKYIAGIKISFEHVDFWAKSLLFRTHHTVRECVRMGAVGARTRKSAGYHCLHSQNFDRFHYCFSLLESQSFFRQMFFGKKKFQRSAQFHLLLP